MCSKSVKLRAVQAQLAAFRPGWEGPAADIFFADMESGARPGLVRLRDAMALTAEAFETTIRTYDEAEQKAAQFDWRGEKPGGAVGTDVVVVAGGAGADVKRGGAPSSRVRSQGDIDGQTLDPDAGFGGLGPGGGGGRGGGGKGGGRFTRIRRAPRQLRLRRLRNRYRRPRVDRVDWDHIVTEHAYRPLPPNSGRTVFPQGWTRDHIEAAVRHVISSGTYVGRRVMPSGAVHHVYRAEYNGIVVEIRYDPTTFTVITAFPPSAATLSRPLLP